MSDILRFFVDRTQTPIGEMVVIADKEGNLRAVDWTDHEPRMLQFLRLHYGEQSFTLQAIKNPHGLLDAIHRYFAGELAAIDTLPVKTAGTAFQLSVWAALRTIPCGTTTTYSKLAKQIGKPSATRAIGLANGSNPIGVIVPCHRVIGANGSLTGYGGGIDRKRWLLEHESSALNRSFPFQKEASLFEGDAHLRNPAPR
jgi:methylated-DNA-[protein]-cysteine S-methyltransferase